MATVVRRYTRIIPAEAVQLAKFLPAGTFVSMAGPLPGEFCDISVSNTNANYATDTNEIMTALGFSFVSENPASTLAVAAAAGVPPVTSIRTTSGPTDLTIGAIADGEFLKRSGANLVGAAASGFDMLDVLIFDHFLTGNIDLDELGWMGWRTSAVGTGAGLGATGYVDRPGVVQLLSGTAAAARASIYLGETTVGGKTVLGGTYPIVATFCFRFPTAADFSSANLESCIMGFGLDWTGDVEQTEGLFIRYAPSAPISDTVYKLVSVTGGVSTVLASTVAPSAATWMKFVFTFTPGGTGATWSVDGVAQAGSITTNIPAGGLGFGLKVRGLAGASTISEWCFVMVTQKSP